ncbi:MAG TPA: membrane protein insertase YidC [Myxococcales bacterium]|nr:membrane protein insertase YidC [Myxococcales bacterium]HIN85273.1 membrane protein insertase YidC [Myxococcales bacterium]
MERRSILTIVIVVIAGILFLVGYNVAGNDDAEDKATKVAPAEIAPAENADDNHSILTLVSSKELAKEFTVNISADGGSLKNVVLHSQQYYQADRSEGAPTYVPTDRLQEGPFEVVSTWRAKYLPFRIVLRKLAWEGDEPGVTTLKLREQAGIKSVSTDGLTVELGASQDSGARDILSGDKVRAPGLKNDLEIIKVEGNKLVLENKINLATGAKISVVRVGSPKALFSDARSEPRFTLMSDKGAEEAVLVWPNPHHDESDVWIERRWKVRDHYTLGHKVKFHNIGSQALTVQFAMEISGWLNPDAEQPSMFTMPLKPWAPSCYVGESLESESLLELLDEDEEPFRTYNGRVNWFGIDSQYFLLAAVIGGDQGVQGSCTVSATSNGVVNAGFERGSSQTLPGVSKACLPEWFPRGKRSPDIRCSEVMKRMGLEIKQLSEARLDIALESYTGVRQDAIMYRKMLLAYDGSRNSGSMSLKIFAGPKDLDLLSETSASLDNSLDFWWFGVIGKPMLHVLRYFHTSGLSWAWSIVFLTIIVKLLLLPLTQKSFVQMQKMQLLKPEMEEIQTKYKNDKEKLQKEMMNLYKRHNMNPLGGCLPMFFQMPVYIALYRCIYSAVDLYQAPLFLWMTDMTQPDPYFVLPVLLGGFMFIQQLFTPSPGGDAAQQKMIKYMMPVMFSMFMLFLPSGLVFYIFISTVMTIGQQWYIRRTHTPATPKTGRSRAA